jgi:hypothetical protein
MAKKEREDKFKRKLSHELKDEETFKRGQERRRMTYSSNRIGSLFKERCKQLDERESVFLTEALPEVKHVQLEMLYQRVLLEEVTEDGR